MKNKSKRDTRRAANILDTAEITGLSTSQIQKVLRQDRDNEKVLNVMMEISESKKRLVNRLKMTYHPDYSSISQFQES